MELTIQQNKVFEQIKAFLNSDASVFILRGYAGTGKTTMVKVIADYIEQTRQLAMMAPTGRAARVLAMKTGIQLQLFTKRFIPKHTLSLKKSRTLQSQSLSLYFLSTTQKMEAILLLL